MARQDRRRRLTLAAGALGSLFCLGAGALAQDASSPTPRGRNEPVVVGHPAPPLTLKDALESGHAWALARLGWEEVFKVHLKQIEGSSEGDYFPQTVVSLGGSRTAGYFLEARCGAGKRKRPCPDRARRVEKRVLAATLLRCMPTGHTPGQLFNLDSFRLRDAGVEDLETIEELTSDAWERVRKLAGLGGSGDRLKAIPLDTE